MGGGGGDVELLGRTFLALRNKVVESSSLPTRFGGHPGSTEVRRREGGEREGKCCWEGCCPVRWATPAAGRTRDSASVTGGESRICECAGFRRPHRRAI